MKRSVLVALFCLALGPTAWASTAQSAPVELLDTGLIATMKAGSAGQGFADREKALEAVVSQTYDLPVVTQNSVGFLWSTLPAGQQQTLIQQPNILQHTNVQQANAAQQRVPVQPVAPQPAVQPPPPVVQQPSIVQQVARNVSEAIHELPDDLDVPTFLRHRTQKA